MEEKIIMGVDPSTSILGYSLIRTGTKPRLIDMGVINMKQEEDHFNKLKHIYEGLQRLISLYDPQEMAIESPFYGKNIQVALKLGRAQGVAIAAAQVRNIPVTEYSPRSIKKAVTGKGNASKEQVSAMLPHLIIGDIQTKYLDATDALAIALCHHFQSTSFGGKVSQKHKNWDSFLKNNPDKQVKL